MSKTFGQLKTGDEVYVIIGSDVEIEKVQNAEIDEEIDDERYVLITIDNCAYSLRSDWTSFHDFMVGDIYSDIDDAMRKMQDILAKALRDYVRAGDALNKLELKKKTL